MASSDSRLPGLLPNSIRDPAVKAFLTHYYNVSNHPPSHDEYADLFTPDGEFSMNAKTAKGRSGTPSPPPRGFSTTPVTVTSINADTPDTNTPDILALRKAIWAHVPARDHSPVRIYTHGDDELDLMVYGTVDYGHHAGHQTSAEWAARMELVRTGEEGLKVKRYHIIVDSAAHV